MKKIIAAALCAVVLNSADAQRVFSYLADFKQVAFYGFADSAGNTKTPGRYNLIMAPSEGISRVWAGQTSSSDYASIRYGYNFINGTELVAPIYNKGEDFIEGMAMVATASNTFANWSYGFINKKGAVEIPLIYKDAKSFSQGLAPVSTESKKWQYIDKEGAVKIAGPFLEADRFSEGLAGVSMPHDLGSGVMSFRKGYIDQTGKMVIAPAYNYVHPFKNGYAIVTFSGDVNGTYKSYHLLIDKTGKRLTQKEYIDIQSAGEPGLYCGKIVGKSGQNTETDKWELFDVKGNLPGAVYKYSLYFSDGLMQVQEGGKHGYMDKSGKMVIKATYAGVRPFSQGLACVQLEEKGLWGFINKKGEVVIKPAYITGSNFSENLAVVSIGKTAFDAEKLTGAIDKAGKTVLPFEKRFLGDFKDGRAVAEDNYISYYQYANGKTSLACNAKTLASARYAYKDLAENRAAQALEAFNKIPDAGCAMVDYWRAYLLLQIPGALRDTVKGAQLMEKAANAGYPEAMYGIGYVYLNGSGGVKDETKARQWLLKAGDKMVPAAWTLLGTTYDKSDPKSAAGYYRKAADMGEPIAMYNLGLLYKEGKGVDKSDAEFRKLMQAAAAKGHAFAKKALEQK